MFFTQRKIKPYASTKITHELTNDLADYLFNNLSELSENIGMVSKEVMFDFVRWLREADRFNGGQSVKKVFNDFINQYDGN
jgi:hypothetical protein